MQHASWRRWRTIIVLTAFTAPTVSACLPAGAAVSLVE